MMIMMHVTCGGGGSEVREVLAANAVAIVEIAAASAAATEAKSSAGNEAAF